MSRLPVLAVDLGAGVRAGFTQRGGGESPPPWDTLNLGLGLHDDEARVLRNRDRVSAWLGAPLALATQVHGTEVIEVTAPAVAGTTSVGAADALVAASPGVGVGVLVADCVPVLLADADAGVVGTAHAGRRGLHAGVLARTLEVMESRGARAGRVRAVVGPCVCGECYEVPEALRTEVSAHRPETWSRTSWGTPALDLAVGAVHELRTAGVQVSRLDACTLTDERFFSHRRASAAGTRTGRFAGVVALA